jgi:hypothetical protein
MLKNTISVFVGVDHFTDVNQYLEHIGNIVSQKINDNLFIEIITIATAQVSEEIRKMYADTEELKSRYDTWPENVSLKYFFSDDNSFNKIRNYTDNEVSGEYGELIALKSIAPIFWLPNHIQAHWDEYKNNKKRCGWLLSKLEIKDIKKADDEKNNTVFHRLEDFPKHIDQIIPDELFITHSVVGAMDFNKAVLRQQNDDGQNIAMFHIGKLVTDEIIPIAKAMKKEGYNPDEITVVQWIDIEAMRNAGKKEEEQAGAIALQSHDNEDGSISFDEEENKVIENKEEK